MNIPLIIRDLLLRNDQLIIPGFGTFKVIHQPAKFSKATQLLLPPSKDIVFDGQQKSGDNQLMLCIKKKLGLSESETNETLNRFIHRLDEEIRNKNAADIEGVGQFKVDNSGKLHFEPVNDLLNLTGVFSLPNIEIPVVPVPEQIRPMPEIMPEPVFPVTRKRKRWIIPAAAILFLAVISFFAYYTGMLDNFSADQSAAETAKTKKNNPVPMVFGNRRTTEKSATHDSISRQLDERTNRENALRIDKIRQKRAQDSMRRAAIPARKFTSGEFHIISGSFLVSGNAEKQQSALRQKGLNPELLPHTGKFYMVSLGSYPTQEEARIAMKKMHELIDQDLWVMKIN